MQRYAEWSLTIGSIVVLASPMPGLGKPVASLPSGEPVVSSPVVQRTKGSLAGSARPADLSYAGVEYDQSEALSIYPASTDRAEFERISVEQGLSHSSVNCILQDSTGFIWFGTNDGLNRYDGYEVVVYQADPGTDGNLSHNTVTSLAEDESGGLWVGTQEGLDRFDPATERFTHVGHNENDPYSLADQEVLALHRDSANRLWVGTSDGLYRLDPETNQFAHYRAEGDDPYSLPDNRILAIFEDSSGVLWLGTWLGLARRDPQSNGFTRRRPAPEGMSELGHNAVHAIVEDQDGTVWFGTGGSGFYRFQPETGELRQVLIDPGDVGGYAHNDVRSIAEDRAGKLWLGTNGAGLYQFDPADNRLTRYQNDPRDSGSLSNNHVNAIYESRRGVLWIGTAGGGVNKLDRDKQKFVLYQADPSQRNSLSQNRVLTLCGDHDGVLWVGTDGGGLDRFDPRNRTFTHFTHDPDDPYSLSNNRVTAIQEGQDGNLWIGTWGGGIARFDREKEQFAHYQADPFDPTSLRSNMVHTVHQDHEGIVWIGTDGGLERFDPSVGNFATYIASEGSVRDIHEDPEHDLWLATDDGLVRLDRESGRVIQYLDASDNPFGLRTSELNALHQDRIGRLWVGTSGGLLRLDPDTAIIEHYGEQDGLPDEVVQSILEDDQGHLWIGTTGGLSRLDPASGRFMNYDVSDGLQGYEFTRGRCQTNDGMMFFGGVSGFNGFYPDQVKDNPFPPPVVLTSVTQTGRDVVAARSLHGAEDVRLTWPNNFFEFTFVALNYHQPEKNRYAYMLEGFDRDWNNVGSRRFGRYTNLPGGTYNLRVKASNNDGIWNEEGISVKVTVVPPFWSTWWFRGGLLLLLVVSAGAGYQMRVRGIEARSRELERMVADRTVALSRANELLKQEIADREKAEEALARRAAEAAVAAERSRLARDLHDAVTQLLFSASLIAEALPGIWENDRDEGRELLAEMRRLSRGALAEMRTLLLELRPAALSETGLGNLLHQLAEAAVGRTDLSIELKEQGEPRLPDDVHVALYRIAQEALNNIIKHARADQVTISLQCVPCGDPGDNLQQVTLSVADDGRGFDVSSVQPDHMGLGIIRERAERIGAELRIESQPGRGSEVLTRWRGPRV
ncbi:MAG: two-component regulator propeller domain-containing protein [Anaerolineae bacterium]